jgi:hypothetical protein
LTGRVETQHWDKWHEAYNTGIYFFEDQYLK